MCVRERNTGCTGQEAEEIEGALLPMNRMNGSVKFQLPRVHRQVSRAFENKCGFAVYRDSESAASALKGCYIGNLNKERRRGDSEAIFSSFIIRAERKFIFPTSVNQGELLFHSALRALRLWFLLETTWLIISCTTLVF